ncbi:hypothetical protein AD929_12350 [Gluconobacter potus]|uniref:Uncharacterized protein n=1 Tax=Gluconobacter potus TaxID=2724927 RepID=A0A149QRX2_9PROT|nr:hypothetical protein AD929_12350 [Gluconobacter potus]
MTTTHYGRRLILVETASDIIRGAVVPVSGNTGTGNTGTGITSSGKPRCTPACSSRSRSALHDLVASCSAGARSLDVDAFIEQAGRHLQGLSGGPGFLEVLSREMHAMSHHAPEADDFLQDGSYGPAGTMFR